MTTAIVETLDEDTLKQVVLSSPNMIDRKLCLDELLKRAEQNGFRIACIQSIASAMG